MGFSGIGSLENCMSIMEIEPAKILVAGSLINNAEAIKSQVESLGHLVIPARAMSLALFLAHKNLPDVIMCNSDLMDGSISDFLRELKVDDELASIPVLFIEDSTAAAKARSTVESLGVDQVLTAANVQEGLLERLEPYFIISQQQRHSRPDETTE